jgi:hypothetical protein
MPQEVNTQVATEEAAPMNLEGMAARLGILEKRCALLESSFTSLVAQVKKAQLMLPQQIVGAMGQIYHELSDGLLGRAQGMSGTPTRAEDLTFIPVDKPTDATDRRSILVKRTGDTVDFYTIGNLDEPENEGTGPIAAEVIKRNLVEDGKAGWFFIDGPGAAPTVEEVTTAVAPGEYDLNGVTPE